MTIIGYRCSSLLAILLGAALFALPGRVSAAGSSYYVTPAGAGDYGGTNWGNAFSNVQDAATLATNDDDNIYLQWGIYSNASQIVISNAAGLTIVGGCVGSGTNSYSGTNSTLTKTGGVMRIVYACNSTASLERVTVSGGSLYTGALNDNGAGLLFQNCAITLDNCVVASNTTLSTVTNGYGGGVFSYDGSLAVNDCVFSNNSMLCATGVYGTPYYPGGGAIAGSNTLLTIAGSAFLENHVSVGPGWFNGGAVFSVGASVLITNCDFRGNYAIGGNNGFGGAVNISGGSVSIYNSTFTSNYTGRSTGYGDGGALYLKDLQLAIVRSNYFADNYIRGPGSPRGSALYIVNCATATVDSCAFDSRGNIVYGEHIYISGGANTYILNTTVWSNHYYKGIYFAGTVASSLVMTNCLVMDNGGGIWFTGRMASLTHNTFANNSQDGILVAGGTAVVAHCVMAHNAGCGASYSGSRSLWLTNCLLAQNGGDGLLISAGTAAVVNCTLADNGGWGFNRTGGTGTVINSIAWGNMAGGFASNANLGVTYSCSQNAPYGVGISNILEDPLFANVAESYYLSRDGSKGQATDSPCFDAGTGLASVYDLTNRTTRTDGTNDTGVVDLGYHYTNGVPDSMIVTTLVCYVDAVTGHDDTGDGQTWGTAWKSVTHALSNVAANATINLATGVYSAVNTLEEFPLTVRMVNLTLSASNSLPSLTVLDNAGTSGRRVLQANVKGSILLKGITFRGGYFDSGDNNGGGLLFQSCAVTLTNCVVSDNTNLNTSAYTNGYGGGIYCSGGSLAVNDCIFSNNYMTRNPDGKYPGGGALAGNNTPMTIADTVFSSNAVVIGAGWFYGGAIYNRGPVLTTITNCDFRENYAIGGNNGFGGAVYISGGSVLIACSAFTSNYTGRSSGYGSGGAVYLINLQSAIVRSNYFADNFIRGASVAYGSALYVSGCSTVMLDNCLVESISKTANAEHVYISGGTNNAMIGSTVRHNSTKRGIVFNGSGASMLGLSNCLVVKNAGDGLFVAAGTATVVNCTIVTNAGWGITNTGVLTVKNSIVWDNTSGGVATNTTTAISYTDSQETLAGAGNMNANPMFLDAAGGDFHVMSLAGSWHGAHWTNDSYMSPCIDAGEPAPGSDYALEPKPNGKRVNMGRYGNTDQASRSSRGTMIRVW